MKVKFFRNAEAVEAPAAAPETDVVVEPQSQPAIDLPSDFMAQMAKSARLVNEGEEAPEYKAEVVADPTETEPVVATDSKPVKGQADTPAKPTDEPIVATQPIAAEPPTEVNWKEQLQKEPPAAILKELGYDERMVNFLEHWKSGGDITEYLKEVATDYTKMDAAELMRHQLRLEYPDATEEQLEVLYEDEVLHKYKMTDDYSEEEQRRGKLLLDAKVSKFRPEFVSRQQSKLVDDSRKSVLDSPYYRKVLTDNKITFGEGGEAFNFPVDANELPDILYNGEKFVQSLFKVGQDANGDFTLQADPEHQMLVAATAKYGKQLFVELAKHYKALGSKKAIDPIENPSTIQTTQSNVPPEPQLSEIAQMAKYGKVT
jgi:hypothetical protein